MLWGSFFQNREHLEKQYRDIAWAEDSGKPPEWLRQKAFEIERQMRGQSRIRIRAAIFDMLLRNAQIQVDPRDWFADRMNHDDILVRLRDRWQEEISHDILPEITDTCNKAAQCGVFFASAPDFSHTSPDWDRILAIGVPGLLESIKRARDEKECLHSLDDEQRDFYAAAQMAYEATLLFMERLAKEALRVPTDDSGDAERMANCAACLHALTQRAPESLYQALQLAYIFHELMEMEGELVRSMGGFDRLYGRLYESDLQSGRLTRDRAKELLQYYFTKFFARSGGIQYGKHFSFGGVDRDGRDVVNSLSCLAFEAYHELHTVDPKLSLRLHRHSPCDITRQVAQMIISGCNSVVFINDDVVIPGLISRGIPLEEARCYIPIGCYEPAVMGKEISCSAADYVNMAKAVELAIFNGVDPRTGIRVGPETGDASAMADFVRFQSAFYKQAEALVFGAMNATTAYEKYWMQMNTSPMLSGTMLECVEKGKDISSGGAKYNNTGCCCCCIASAVDAMLAVKRIVYTEKRYTFSQLQDMLMNNWECHELERLRLLKYPEKWGNDLEAPDAMACALTSRLEKIINGYPNGRGGRFIASLLSINQNHPFGLATGALPDGRLAGEPLSKNLGAVTGMDRNGVTGLIKSASKIDQTCFSDGGVLDIMLHPSAVQGEDGLQALIGLVETYFTLGGQSIQFNIFDARTLREAQKNPDRYANLQVRVAGWNVFFINLNQAEQNEFIRQAEALR